MSQTNTPLFLLLSGGRAPRRPGSHAVKVDVLIGRPTNEEAIQAAYVSGDVSVLNWVTACWMPASPSVRANARHSDAGHGIPLKLVKGA